MGSKSNYIEVSSSRLTVCSGSKSNQTISSRSISRDDLEEWYSGQSDRISSYVHALIAEGSLVGPTTIFYQSPSLSCDLYSCPSTIKDAEAAAHLALGQRSNLDLDRNPWCIQTWSKDRTGSPRRKHLLIASDSARTIEKIRSIAPESRQIALIPLEATLTTSAVDCALKHSASDRPMVVVHIGQSRSVIAAAHQHQLLLVRPVDVGTDRLIEALATTLGLPGQESIGVAEQVLFGSGLPAEGQTITIADRQFTAADILPAIQPVLQRLLVEIRQSIRFGLSGLDAEPGILIQGSGASINRLAAAFQRELEVPCVADTSRALHESTDIAFAIEAVNSGLRLTLRAQESSSRASIRTSQIALYAGAAAAIAIGAGYGLWTMDQIRSIEPRLSELASVYGSEEKNPSKDARSEASIAGVHRVIESIDTFVGRQTDVASAIREICLLTADDIALTVLDVSGGQERSVCQLRGYLRDPGPDAAAQIRTLIDRLRESPLVESVRLEGTEIATLDETQTVYFSASIILSSTERRILNDPSLIASVDPEALP